MKYRKSEAANNSDHTFLIVKTDLPLYQCYSNLDSGLHIVLQKEVVCRVYCSSSNGRLLMKCLYFMTILDLLKPFSSMRLLIQRQKFWLFHLIPSFLCIRELTLKNFCISYWLLSPHSFLSFSTTLSFISNTWPSYELILWNIPKEDYLFLKKSEGTPFYLFYHTP